METSSGKVEAQLQEGRERREPGQTGVKMPGDQSREVP